MNYLVKSPGRTGSIYIAQWIAKHQGCIYMSTHTPNFYERLHQASVVENLPVVVHDHYEFVPLWPRQWVLICSDRKNKLDGILSAIIAEETGNWGTYDKPYPDSITVDFERVKEKHKGRRSKTQHDAIVANSYFWHKTYRMHKEDLSHDYLAPKLHFNEPTSLTSKFTMGVQQSPYNKKTFISNYYEIKKQYHKWTKIK